MIPCARACFPGLLRSSSYVTKLILPSRRLHIVRELRVIAEPSGGGAWSGAQSISEQLHTTSLGVALWGGCSAPQEHLHAIAIGWPMRTQAGGAAETSVQRL